MAIESDRKKIDAVDAKILELLNQRAQLAKAIGEEKRKKKIAIYDPEREKKILDALKGKNKGPFPDRGIDFVFSEIISASRDLEKPIRVSYLGPATTFTHMAAVKKFGSAAEFVSRGSIRGVFDAVEKRQADYGVIPIENSTEGTINYTLDMFLDYELDIVGEVSLEIMHNLLSKYKLYEIKKLYAPQIAVAQCRRWVDKNLPNVETVDASSTAKAAEQASLYLKSAAIASELAANKYKLNVLAKSIEDSRMNITRFLVIGRGAPKRTGKDKTSIVFSVKHKAGALFEALKAFQKHGINMTKIESRPTPGRVWEYVFFVDFQGFSEDEKARKALAELQKACSFVRILGSYPEEAFSGKAGKAK